MATLEKTVLFYKYLEENNLEQVRNLLNEDATLLLDRIGDNDRIALHMAAEKGHVEMVKLLLTYNKDGNLFIDTQNLPGNTALHYAVMNEHLAVAELLIKAGADKEIKNKKSLTALDYLPFTRDNVNLFLLLTNPESYFEKKEKEEREANLAKAANRKRVKIGLMVIGGVLSAGALVLGITALALTLAGVAFLPFTGIAILIGAAVLAGVGLGLTTFATYRYNANRAEDTKDPTPETTMPEKVDTAERELGDDSHKKAIDGLGGSVPNPDSDQQEEQIPLIPTAPVLASADAEKQPASESTTPSAANSTLS